MKFDITYLASMQVEARDITEALQKVKDMHPELQQIKNIRMNGRVLAWETSRETGENIYYKPGCLCGQTDCINDPMREIARACAHQSDMMPDKWESCAEPDPYDDNCYNYVT